MSEAAFLQWWNKSHDYDFHKDIGMYEKHAYKCFMAGYHTALATDDDTGLSLYIVSAFDEAQKGFIGREIVALTEQDAIEAAKGPGFIENITAAYVRPSNAAEKKHYESK
jgi:hypothetical protein